MTEILNIDYHRRRLVVKALNKSDTVEGAALLLGVTDRMVYFYKIQYNIVWDTGASVYKINPYAPRPTF